MNAQPLTLLFSGGGTGGHLYPGIAIADEIRRRHPGTAISFAGTKGRIEARIVPSRGYPFTAIWISGLRRRLSLQTVLFPVKVLVSLMQSLVLIRRMKPDAVIGTGGYVSGPVVFAAQLRGVPTLVQEQNSFPGLTTRLLAPRAREVHLAFEQSRRYFKRQNNVHVSGNPTRDILGSTNREEAAAHFGIDPTKRTLLIFGGSLGAASINIACEAAAPSLVAEGMQIIWQTGEQDFRRVQTAVQHLGDAVKLHAYIDRMEYAYAACDLVVCRAGATSLAELTRCGLPSILVPYPFAAADHQTENARALAVAGAACLVPDREAGSRLPLLIRELFNDPPRLRGMADAARRLGKPEATAVLADAVLRVANEGRK